MKIGILTQQLRTNYGGILQAFALQTVLQSMGHDVTIIRREEPTAFSNSKKAKIKFLIKYYIKKLLNKPNIPYVNFKEQGIISSKINLFIKKYVKHTNDIYYTSREMKNMHQELGFDVYIVGSDQVWRPFYSPCITDYFLGFCKSDNNIKRLSYAASFGVDVWEFNNKQELICKELVQLFDAVSVREVSGIEICRNYLNCSAEHVLDPTMLLKKDDYISIVNAEGEIKSKGDCFYYILNMNEAKKEFISKIEEYYGYKSFTVMPEKIVEDGVENLKEEIEKYIFPSVTQWLRAYMDANIILTDSFHGCVFSIIFNKPFWVVGNVERGNARFDSLLKTFNLEERLLDINNLQTHYLNKDIDWNRVNDVLYSKREESLNYLYKNL